MATPKLWGKLHWIKSSIFFLKGVKGYWEGITQIYRTSNSGGNLLLCCYYDNAWYLLAGCIYPWCLRSYGVSGRSQNSRKAWAPHLPVPQENSLRALISLCFSSAWTQWPLWGYGKRIRVWGQHIEWSWPCHIFSLGFWSLRLGTVNHG